MKARPENVTLVFNGPEEKELVAFIRFDQEKTKKTLVYLLSDTSQEDITKLINNS